MLFTFQTETNTASGTIIVFGLSKTKIVVAADTRQTNKRTNDHNDNSCKFIVLADRVVFATTGMAEFRSAFPALEPTASWNAEDVARSAYESFRASDASKSTAIVSGLSAFWAQKMIAKFEDFRMRPPAWKAGDAISSGFFCRDRSERRGSIFWS